MATDRQSVLDDLQAKVSDFLKGSPVADIERNIKALIAQAFQRLDLVTHDEFEIQGELVQQLLRRVTELERVVTQLEAKPTVTTPPAAASSAASTFPGGPTQG